MKRLVVFSEDTTFFSAGGYRVRNTITRLFGELTHWFDKVVVSSPVADSEGSVVGFVEDRVSFSPRPYYGGSVLGFIKHLPKIVLPTIRNVERNVKWADIVLLRLPSPVGLWVYRRARANRTPYFLYVAGDIRRVATQGEKYKGFLMRSLVALGASVFHLWTKRMAKGALVFVTGSQLHLELAPLAKRCVSIIPSVISGSDIFWRENSCETLPIQLLYVGRLVPVKGLRYLLGAVKLLQDRGIEVKLQLVGGGAQKAELIAQAADLGVTERVTFTGRVPFGPDLLARYRQADIFILPSLSEGVPKTLLEAMASGLPVVATRVGGVPDVVCDNETGILVNPRAPDELAHAVERLIMDPKLRKTMIENAYVFVGEHTVEKQAGRMWQEIRDSFHLEDE